MIELTFLCFMFEGIDVNKRTASKEYDVCHY